MHQTPQALQSALAALVELANGYGKATSDQIAQVAAKYEMECWNLEGMYFDATETAGEDEMGNNTDDTARAFANAIGYEACLDGVLLRDNPHAVGSDEFRAWEAGHLQAASVRREWEDCNS
jgi:hypothetical protein